MQKFKLLILSTLFILPSTMFGIVGFGLNVIQDGMKLDGYVAEDIPGVTLEAFEMEGSPIGAGGYFFIDLSGFLRLLSFLDPKEIYYHHHELFCSKYF